MSGWRLYGGSAVDQSRTLHFTLDGKPLSGFAGDTLASALLASGETILGRSFKYHRPRGLWGHGHEEPNALFDVSHNGVHTPNVRATTEALRDGHVLSSVNTTPTAERDHFALLDRLHRFLPAGFYYKTFMRFGWMRWEPMIRRLAGLGQIDPRFHPPADCAHINTHCDLLVIGAGPAGLAAAHAAAARGQRVFLVDDGDCCGGSLHARGGTINGAPWQAFARDTETTVTAAGGRVLTRTVLWGAFDHGSFGAWQRRTDAPDILHVICAKQTVVAAGAIERPLWFGNNDLPGVMSAESALHYVSRYGAVAGRVIVLATGNDASYPVAQALADIGCTVHLVDARSETPPAPDRVHHHTGNDITQAIGKRCVQAVRLRSGETIPCDTVLASGGYTPSVHLHCQAGGKLDWNAELDALVPRPNSAPLRTAGAANGCFGLDLALATGHAAGGGEGPAPTAEASSPHATYAFRPQPDTAGRVWIDPQNDVTLRDVSVAAREGFQSVEHLKRYTTLGMATDQGRSSNFAGLAAMSMFTGRSITQTGTTTYRPPFAPVPLGVIGGRRRGELFNPLKRLTLESAHRAAGAQFREYSGWLRPSVYGDGDEAALAQAEAKSARENAALIDASPLGKLDVIGPDAARLLDYCNYRQMSTLQPNRARYGFTLAESGVVIDDGIIIRLTDNHFVVSTSSAHVSRVRLILEEARQDRFNPRRVFIHDQTHHWTTLSVSGPHSSALIESAGIALPNIPHLGAGRAQLADVPLRVARISFCGDICFEISVATPHAASLHAALSQAAVAHGGRWTGLEALLILRAEKGFIIVGKDTDGNTQPHDLGWRGPRTNRDDEYLGKRSLFSESAEDPQRRQLVGLDVIDGDTPLATGAHLIPLSGQRRSLGFVTTSVYSPTLNKPIALALLENGRGKLGDRVGVFHLDSVRVATVTPACALDPAGDRLHA